MNRYSVKFSVFFEGGIVVRLTSLVITIFLFCMVFYHQHTSSLLASKAEMIPQIFSVFILVAITICCWILQNSYHQLHPVSKSCAACIPSTHCSGYVKNVSFSSKDRLQCRENKDRISKKILSNLRNVRQLLHKFI